MEKEIRNQLLRMIGTIIGFVALGLYAFDFVYDGVMATPSLNLTIFGVFFMAAAIVFSIMLSLRNEVEAMKALQVDYGRRAEFQESEYRAPAKVFAQPVLLGGAYRLITEELGRQQQLQIPTSTVQVIVASIDQRINERKSTLTYFAGLMVFLGLFGTFVGLMKTVGSVGDLIGGLDMSGGGGDEAFAGLIEGMKAPLGGMAIGFSSSLFGLATSLVAGMLERFMTAAMKSLRNEFESWLNKLAQLESSGTEEVAETGRPFGRRAIRRMAMIESKIDRSLTATEQAAHSITELAASVEILVSRFSPESVDMSDAVARLAEQIAGTQRDAMQQVTALVQMQMRDRSDLKEVIAALQNSFFAAQHGGVPGFAGGGSEAGGGHSVGPGGGQTIILGGQGRSPASEFDTWASGGFQRGGATSTPTAAPAGGPAADGTAASSPTAGGNAAPHIHIHHGGSAGDVSGYRNAPSAGGRLSGPAPGGKDARNNDIEEADFYFPDLSANQPRTFLNRIYRAFAPADQKARASMEARYGNLANALAKSTDAAHKALYRGLSQLEEARVADRNALFRFRQQQEILASSIAVLAQRLDQFAESVSKAEDAKTQKLRAEMRQSRYDLELALKHLELQFEAAQAAQEDKELNKPNAQGPLARAAGE